jgi:hypothetical protein
MLNPSGRSLPVFFPPGVYAKGGTRFAFGLIDFRSRSASAWEGRRFDKIHVACAA